MPQRKRASLKWDNFNMPLSYRVNERRNRFSLAENVFWNQSRLDTRYGTERLNDTALPSNILSLSYFKDTSGNRYNLAKSVGIIYNVAANGASTELKTGLDSTKKHRGLTLNNRHIVSCESNGLFQFNGTDFTQLGQAAPSTPSVALGVGAGSLTDDTYTVKTTYYSEANGFETNASVASASVTTSAPNSRIVVTSPAAAANTTCTKYRVYVSIDDITWYLAKNDAGDTEVSVGTDFNVDDDITSTQVPPTTHAAPLSGGGKYLTSFNRKLVYAGNSNFKNDVFFSEQDLPDAFDDTETRLVLFAGNDGEITGLATGFFNDSHLDPYLVVFKRRSTWIYSELSDFPRFEQVDNKVGCVSGDNIIVRNGNVYFLSDQGWKVINNGTIIQEKDGTDATLGLGDVDDVFRRENFDFSVTKSTLAGSFGVYYGELDQYLSWIGDNGSTAYNRTYNFEFSIGGFKTYNFNQSATCACISEDSDDNEQVLMGTSNGFIIKHSKSVPRSDVNLSGGLQSYNVRIRLIWVDNNDMATSHNFRMLFLKSLSGDKTILVKGYVNYALSGPSEDEFIFDEDGFILGTSILGVGVLRPGIRIKQEQADINRVGENILLEFSLNEINSNIGLVALQLDYNTNGNRN